MPCGKPQAAHFAHVTELLQWLPGRLNFTGLEHYGGRSARTHARWFARPFPFARLAVAALAERFEDIEILYPVHPNPRVLEPARRILGGRPRVHLTDPLDYGDLVTVLGRASLVLTDSGGIQEEAPAFGVHTLVLREVTERPEGVRAGAATLVGTDADLILNEATAHLNGARDACPAGNPYGDGRAGARIADILLAELTGTPRRLEDWNAP